MGKKRIGSGYVLAYSSSGTQVGPWVPVTNAKMTSEIAQQRQEIDATPLSATSKEYIPGLAEGQNINVEMFYVNDDASQNALKALYDEGTDIWFRLRHPAVTEQDEHLFRMTPLNWSVGDFSAENIIMTKLSGRLSGDPIKQTKTV